MTVRPRGVEAGGLFWAAVPFVVIGPYLSRAAGVRSEALAVAVLGVAALVHARGGRSSSPGLLFSASLAVATVAYGIVASVGSPSPFSIAQFEAFATLTLILLFGALRRQTPWDGFFARRFFQGLFAAMTASAGVALLSQAQRQLPAWLIDWVSTGRVEEGIATVVRSAAQGRYLGLFAQPSEAAIGYGLALLSSIYLLYGKQRGDGGGGVLVILGGVSAVVGGLLSGSKGFFFLVGGIAIASLFSYFIKNSMSVTRSAIVASLTGGVFIAVQSFLPILLRQSRYVSLSTETLIPVVTGNRYGTSGAVPDLIGSAVGTGGLFGAGFSDPIGPFDSAWVAWLWVGGAVGCLLLMGVVGGLIAHTSHAMRLRSEQRVLSSGLIVLLAAATFGAPVLTINRGATLFLLALVWAPSLEPLGSTPHQNSSARAGGTLVA